MCAIDGRRGVGVHLENVHKLRAGNRQLTNLRNPDEMFRYRKKRKPAPRTVRSTLCIWEVLVHNINYIDNTNIVCYFYYDRHSMTLVVRHT